MKASAEGESVFFEVVAPKRLPMLQEGVLHPFPDRQHEGDSVVETINQRPHGV